MKQFITVAIIAALLALTPVCANAQEAPATDEEIAAAIEAINAAETGPDARSAYAAITRRALDSVELRDAYLEKLLSLGRAEYGAGAAEQLLTLAPDNLNALRVAAYARAEDEEYPTALAAALRAAIQATNDEATLTNLGQLAAYMQLDETAPEIDAETLALLEASTDALSELDAYAEAYGRIAGAYETYLTGLEEVQTAMDEAQAERERLEAQLESLEAQLSDIRAEKREIERQIRAQGGGVGVGGASGQQQTPPELQEVQDRQRACQAEITDTENDLRALRGPYLQAQDDLEDYIDDRDRMIRREGGVMEFVEPAALDGDPVPLGGQAPEPAPNPEPMPDPDAEPDYVSPLEGGNEPDAPAENADDAALVLDNDTSGDALVAQGQEFWVLDNSLPDMQGDTFIHDNNAGKGQAQIGVVFTPAAAGSYEVLAYCPTFAQAATNVPVQIHHAGGMATATYDQRNNGGQWVSLGTYTFDMEMGGAVIFLNADTDGYVLFDAIKLVEATPAVIIGQPIALPVQE